MVATISIPFLVHCAKRQQKPRIKKTQLFAYKIILLFLRMSFTFVGSSCRLLCDRANETLPWRKNQNLPTNERNTMNRSVFDSFVFISPWRLICMLWVEKNCTKIFHFSTHLPQFRSQTGDVIGKFRSSNFSNWLMKTSKAWCVGIIVFIITSVLLNQAHFERWSGCGDGFTTLYIGSSPFIMTVMVF